MKKFLLLAGMVGLFLGVQVNAAAQAKKPTIMVVPSDAWCNQNGYMLEYDNQGRKDKAPDYYRALQENTDLLLVISKINELMAERGFPLKNLESAMKTLRQEAAEDALAASSSGESVAESPIDKLKKTAKADIWMQLTWTVNVQGPKRSITFNLQGLDAYTDKQIAGASGTGAQSFASETAVLLEEAVLAHIDNFNVKLQGHFEDMFANGREVILRIKRWNSMDGDLDTEFGDMTLGEIIDGWVNENTVNHRYSQTDASENMMLFEQVRIPLFDANQKALDTKTWARQLQKMLKEKYQIESKLGMKGLGQAVITVGEK